MGARLMHAKFVEMSSEQHLSASWALEVVVGYQACGLYLMYEAQMQLFLGISSAAGLIQCG